MSSIKSLLGESNIKYTTISDKVSDEILQCGIDYFKHFKDTDKDTDNDPSKKTMALFNSAKKIAIGNIVKQRCEENIEYLQEWIDNKPERDKLKSIEAYLNSLVDLLDFFEKRSDAIENAKTLIYQSKPLLNNIKSILGVNDEVYLKLSTRVAIIVQHKIIEDVNNSVNNLDTLIAIDRNAAINKVRSIIKNAWEATQLLGSLDMESDFKKNQYETNKESLKDLSSQFGITNSFNDSNKIVLPLGTSTTYREKPVIKIPTTPTNKVKPVINLPNYNSTNNKSDNSGCMIPIVVFVIIIIIAIASNNSKSSSSNNTYKSTDSVVVAVDSATANTNPVSTATDFSKSPQATNNGVDIKESKFKGNQLSDGASPLNQCFGKGKFRGKAWIQFNNNSLTDAIVCLVNVNTGKTIRNEYIRAGSSFKMRKIPGETYYLKTYYGKDWNPHKKNYCGTKGGFDTEEQYSKSDISNNIVIENDQFGYTTGTITLYGVSNGNMSNQTMNESEFFNE